MARKQGKSQAIAGRQALRWHSVEAMPCKGLFFLIFQAFYSTFYYLTFSHDDFNISDWVVP